MSHPRDHTAPLFGKLHTLTLTDINKLKTGIFMFKFTNNLLPHTFSNYFLSVIREWYSPIGAFPLERNSAIHFSIFASRCTFRFFFVWERKKLTNKRDPNRDPNRSSACDFLETARLFAARCVWGHDRKEKIDKLHPRIQCAQISNAGAILSTEIVVPVGSLKACAVMQGQNSGMRSWAHKKIEKWIAIHFSIFLPCVNARK